MFSTYPLLTVPSEGPKGISFDDVGQTTYNISWAPLAREKRNGIITEYEIKREKASTGARSKRSTGDITYSKSENTFAVVSGFQPGCKYKISVRAFTTIGPGPFGEEKTLESELLSSVIQDKGKLIVKFVMTCC